VTHAHTPALTPVSAPEHRSPPGFSFGHGYFDRKRTFAWQPDLEPNAHAIIWGASGSGKSRLLRQIVSYLSASGKHVHVIDQHGDLFVEGENTLRFGDVDTTYGINPFEYERTPHAGPSANIHAMVEIFRRTYMKSMRSVQEMVLRQLLTDSYRCVGIDPDRIETWQGVPQLPSIDNTSELLAGVMQAIENGASDFLADLRESTKTIAKLRQSIDTLTGKSDRTSSDEEKLRKQENDIENIIEQMQEALGVHLRQVSVSEATPATHILIDGNPVDIGFYMRKNAARTLESLSLYIDALSRHGVFSCEPPPVRAGLNRYDLSLLPDGPRHFFIECLLAKVFRAVRMRGEYRKLARRPRGDRVDTFIVIDEAQTILPTRPAEKENHSYILNRLASEARKYGLGLICVTQSPAVFPKLMFSNVVLKIGLRTNQNDIASAINYLGVKDHALFEHIKRDGIAIVGGKESEFHSVVLDWGRMEGAAA
jgi:hypothetical protein